MHFVFDREYCNVFIFTSALIFFSKSTLRVYDSILGGSKNKSCSEKRKYTVNLSSLWAVCLANRQVVEMGWKFSLICALALYMLNKSKLYLGRHICLSICLWFYRNDYLCEEHKFQRKCEAETTPAIFSFGCNNSSEHNQTIFFYKKPLFRWK